MIAQSSRFPLFLPILIAAFMTGPSLGQLSTSWGFGFEHQALGAATLQHTAMPGGEQLIIANIGSSGLDGVKICVGDAIGYGIIFSPITGIATAAPGAWKRLQPNGSVGGQVAALGALIHTRGNGTGGSCDIDVSIDYGTTGATMCNVMVYDERDLVLEVTGVAGPLMATLGCDADFEYVRTEGMDLVYEMRFPSTNVTIPGGPTIAGTRLRIVIPTAQMIDSIVDVEIVALGFSQFALDGGFVLEFEYDAAGRFRAGARADTTSCGATGVSCLRLHDLDVGPAIAPKFEMSWLGDPVSCCEIITADPDPSGTLPAGASVSWTVQGGPPGAPPQVLATLSQMKTGMGTFMAMHDLSPLTPPSVALDVMLGGTQLLSLPISGGTATYESTDLPNTTGWCAGDFNMDDPFKSTTEWDLATMVTVMVAGTPLTIQADAVVVRANTAMPRILDRIVLRTTSVSELVLTGHTYDLAMLGPRLTLDQDPVSFDFMIALTGGDPSAAFLLFYSVDPANGTSPGSGILGGLHITIPDIIFQAQLGMQGNPLFGGMLDPSGNSMLTIPGVMIPGLTLYGLGVTIRTPGSLDFTPVASHVFF